MAAAVAAPWLALTKGLMIADGLNWFAMVCHWFAQQLLVWLGLRSLANLRSLAIACCALSASCLVLVRSSEASHGVHLMRSPLSTPLDRKPKDKSVLPTKQQAVASARHFPS